MIMIQWRLEDNDDEVNVECFDKGTKEKALIKHYWQEVFPSRRRANAEVLARPS